MGRPSALLVVAALAAMAATASATDWTLHLLDPVKYPTAKCLDGSPGAFYVSPGSGPDASKFVIHLQDGGDGGALSSDPAVNPLLASYTRVFVGYCSGDSFASSVAEPVRVNATFSFYFRGRAILDAVFDTLYSQYELGSAPTVIIKGCSAGGMAAFLHGDRLVAQLRAANPTGLFLVWPGAGTILRFESFGGGYPMDAGLTWLWNNGNLSSSANPACLADHANATQLCFFPQVSLQYFTSPLFVTNSLADAAQLGGGLVPCNPATDSCSQAELAYVNSFRLGMLSALQRLLSPSSTNGLWVVECFYHVLEDDTGAWANITVAGQTQRDTFGAWLLSQEAAHRGRLRVSSSGQASHASLPMAPQAFPAVWYKSVDGPWGTNPTCGGYTSTQRL